MKKILVIQTAFLGDAILATSLLEKLHHSHPTAEKHILVRKGNESIFENHPFATVKIWDKTTNKITNLFKLLLNIRREKYDAVINLQRFFSTGLLTAFSGASYRAGFDKNPLSFFFSKSFPHIIGDGRHETERILTLAGDDIAGKVKPVLYPTATDLQKIEQYINVPFITIAPASVWFTKKLPAEMWSELIAAADKKLAVYLIGSKADAELCDEIIANSGITAATNLAGKLSLLQTAALMRKAVMNYVNDSAPIHLASAMNANVTAFFCSTIPEFGFGPLSDNSVIVQSPEKLLCKPCGLHGRNECPVGHFRCGFTIKLPTPALS
jgi:ADP-heptose:LPS heptosyltransferase